MNIRILALVLIFTHVVSNQSYGALSAPTLTPGFNNSIGLGASINVGNQNSSGFGISLIDYSRRIQGPWSITMGIGFDKKWTDKDSGTEQTSSYSISTTLAYDLISLPALGLPASMSVFGGAAQDFSSYNKTTGLHDEDLGTSIGGGVSFSWPVANRWSVSLSPLMAYELDSSELSLEVEFSGAYSF